MAKKLQNFDPKAIRLTAEQKLTFRGEQVRVLSLLQQATALRSQADDLTRQAMAGEQGLQNIVSDIAKVNHADPAKYEFAVDTLQFTIRKSK